VLTTDVERFRILFWSE